MFDDCSESYSFRELRKIVSYFSTNGRINVNDIRALSSSCQRFIEKYLGNHDASSNKIDGLRKLFDNVIETATYQLPERTETQIEICDSSTDCKVILTEVLAKLFEELGEDGFNEHLGTEWSDFRKNYSSSHRNYLNCVTSSDESQNGAAFQWEEYRKNYDTNFQQIFGLD